MIKNVCFSGGAPGADMTFGNCAGKAGHKVIHWSFEEHYKKRKCPPDFVLLNQEQLELADPYLKEVNKVLKRKFPLRDKYYTNLIRRDFYQVDPVNSVYAVSSINNEGIVKGGTGWAVHRAILKGVDKINVYDQDTEWWYCWDYKYRFWDRMSNIPPYPKDKYAGIGTRHLNMMGSMAIRALYKKE